MEQIEQNVYPFPYCLLPESAKIILYGAGKMGSSYYEQLQRDRRIEVVLWVDKNYQKMNIEGRPVAGTDRIKETEFDFILIAIENRAVAMEAMEELERNGTDHKKIIWSQIAGNTAIRDPFFYRAFKSYRKVTGWQTGEEKRPRFFLFLTPEHGNLGDEAILLAERKFFKYYFPDKELFEITEWEWENSYLIDYSKIISREDIIFIQGGGNFGDLWANGKWIRRIVEAFPDNKIIMLPQTLTYKDNSEEAMERDAAFYRRHKNLHLFARERASYEKMRRLRYREENDLRYYPDMVLWGTDRVFEGSEDTALLCMREDEERSVALESAESIKGILKKRGIPFKETNTLLYRDVFGAGIQEAVENKLAEFSKAFLVVTDRLHGMVFAAITGTPCIAFNNATGKVAGVYQWIRELPWVRYVESVSEFEKCLQKLQVAEKHRYEPGAMRKEFGKMAERIREIIE